MACWPDRKRHSPITPEFRIPRTTIPARFQRHGTAFHDESSDLRKKFQELGGRARSSQLLPDADGSVHVGVPALQLLEIVPFPNPFPTIMSFNHITRP